MNEPEKETKTARLKAEANDDTLFQGFARSGMTAEDIRKVLYMYERDEALKDITFPSKPCGDGFYRMWVKDITAKGGRRQITSKNLENLKERVYRMMTGLPAPKRLTFEEAFKMAQEFEKTNCSKARVHSKENTIARNQTEYNRFFAGTGFAQRALEDITIQDLDRMIRNLVHKYDLSKKGLESVRGIINMTFKRARFNGVIKDNVAAGLIWKDYMKLVREPTPIAKRAYTDEELALFDEYIANYHKKRPGYIPAYALEFQILTGTRRGEIPPLTWDDVDFENGTICIHREQICGKGENKGDYIVEYTKNGLARYYPIADLEREFLQRLKKIDEKYYPDSPFLFPAKSENGCITSSTVYQFFRRMCQHYNLPFSKDCMRGTHAFRRNAITEVVNNSNGNLILASQIFGNSPETIKNYYYTNDRMETKRELLNRRKRKVPVCT